MNVIRQGRIRARIACLEELKEKYQQIQTQLIVAKKVLDERTEAIDRILDTDLNPATKKTLCGEVMIRYRTLYDFSFSPSIDVEVAWLETNLSRKKAEIEGCESEIAVLKGTQA